VIKEKREKNKGKEEGMAGPHPIMESTETKNSHPNPMKRHRTSKENSITYLFDV